MKKIKDWLKVFVRKIDISEIKGLTCTKLERGEVYLVTLPHWGDDMCNVIDEFQDAFKKKGIEAIVVALPPEQHKVEMR